jgi:hypothetical protein
VNLVCTTLETAQLIWEGRGLGIDKLEGAPNSQELSFWFLYLYTVQDVVIDSAKSTYEPS